VIHDVTFTQTALHLQVHKEKEDTKKKEKEE
jgi:hypothetical protein